MEYKLGDECVVPWTDSSMYVGRVTKIMDPKTRELIGNATKRGEIVKRSLDSILADQTRKVSKRVINECLDSQENRYYVHYLGWKPNFDEWLPVERMLPKTQANLDQMKKVNQELKEAAKKQKEAGAEKKKQGKQADLEPQSKDKRPKRESRRAAKNDKKVEPNIEPLKVPAPAKRREKRSRKEKPSGDADEPVDEVKEPAAKKVKVDSKPAKPKEIEIENTETINFRLQFPLDLKRILVQDWEYVTKDRLILKLPRAITLVQILREFYEEYECIDDGENENLKDFCESIAKYFDHSLGMMLLYRFERNQYYLVRNNDPTFAASEVYGAEHLLRLIVSMPTLLSQVDMDNQTFKYIMARLNDLVVYLNANKVRYFAGAQSYDAATRVYQALSVPDMAGTAPPPEDEQEKPQTKY